MKNWSVRILVLCLYGYFKTSLTTFVYDHCIELCEVMEAEEAGSEAQTAGPVQYQCLDCLALFGSPDTWLEHRRTHSRSSTHSNTETTVREPKHTLTQC